MCFSVIGEKLTDFIGTIVYIGGMEMPDRNAAAHRALNNAKIFRELGYNVVFCGIDKLIDRDIYPPVQMGNFSNCPAKHPVSPKEWLKSLYDFSHIKRVLDTYDDIKFVVAYNMHSRPLSWLIGYCKKRNIKVIADITEWYENKFSFSPVKFIKWLDTFRVMKRLYKKVDGIIAISKYLTDYYSSYVKQIVQIPPLIDIEEEIWKNIPFDYLDKVEFVYSGVPGATKDRIELIVECLADLNDNYDFLFNVIGITKEQFIEYYPNFVKLLDKLDNKIAFHGRVSHTESIFALRKADYCIFIRERTRKNMAGFPTKFAECVTAGVGVIANDISNIKDYYPLDNSEIISSVDKTDIKTAIVNAIGNGKIRHKALNLFDYRNYIEKIKLFLSKVNK